MEKVAKKRVRQTEREERREWVRHSLIWCSLSLTDSLNKCSSVFSSVLFNRPIAVCVCVCARACVCVCVRAYVCIPLCACVCEVSELCTAQMCECSRVPMLSQASLLNCLSHSKLTGSHNSVKWKVVKWCSKCKLWSCSRNDNSSDARDAILKESFGFTKLMVKPKKQSGTVCLASTCCSVSHTDILHPLASGSCLLTGLRHRCVRTCILVVYSPVFVLMMNLTSG